MDDGDFAAKMRTLTEKLGEQMAKGAELDGMIRKKMRAWVATSEGEVMALNVDHLLRTAATLEQALLAIARTPVEDAVMFDLFRNAAIKSFELSLETAGKLIRKALKGYGASPRSVDALVFNDVIRHAGKHGLLDEAGVERWLAYRANRNSTAHYGEGFANVTLKLLPVFLQDVRTLAAPLQGAFDAAA